jgi:hypothetical protein
MYEVLVDPPPECTAMSHLRGEIAPGAPVFGVLTTQERSGGSAEKRAAELARPFVEPCEPRRVQVSGSRRAARVDGRIEMEEGLSEDGVERISIVVAELKREFAVLTVRTRPRDAVERVVDGLMASFGVRGETGGLE